MNPTEKGSTSHESPVPNYEAEPAWVRDVLAAAIDIDIRDPEKYAGIVAEICEGEKSFCEHCGAEAPLWPTKQWADHILTEHGPNLTIQARSGTSMMCEDKINQAQQIFFSMMLGARVSMRRRAWQRNLLIVKPLPGGRPAN